MFGWNSNIETFERKTQHKFVLCQNKLFANSFFQEKLFAL